MIATRLAVYYGVIFFVIGNTQPIYHTIWHLFVLLAAVFLEIQSNIRRATRPINGQREKDRINVS